MKLLSILSLLLATTASQAQLSPKQSRWTVTEIPDQEQIVVDVRSNGVCDFFAGQTLPALQVLARHQAANGAFLYSRRTPTWTGIEWWQPALGWVFDHAAMAAPIHPSCRTSEDVTGDGEPDVWRYFTACVNAWCIEGDIVIHIVARNFAGNGYNHSFATVLYLAEGTLGIAQSPELMRLRPVE